MQNQAAVEALYSATFVEDYLDCVENLPNNLQIFITKLREFDLIQYNEFLKDFGSLVTAFEQETTASGQRAILLKIQHGLILAQDIGDGKLSTVQAMTDLLETRTRQLEHDSQNAEFVKVEADEYDHRSSPAIISTTSGNNAKQMSSSKGSKNRIHEEKVEKSSVKKRKKMIEKSGRDSAKDSGANSSPTDEDESLPTKSSASSTSATKSRSSVGSAKKSSNLMISSSSPAVKRKHTKRSASNVEREDSDHGLDQNNVEIDPDEPTYCLCDQISYGEMIGCDNDLCPIEWFHFSCVQLTTKPKGKWFCPKCRGDKPTMMKPKALFLKELDKYNKEKGEKAMKQSG